MTLRDRLRGNPLMLAALAGGVVVFVRAANIYMKADVTMLQALSAAVGLEPVPMGELEEAGEAAAKAAASITPLPVMTYGGGTFPTSEIVANPADTIAPPSVPRSMRDSSESQGKTPLFSASAIRALGAMR